MKFDTLFETFQIDFAKWMLKYVQPDNNNERDHKFIVFVNMVSEKTLRKANEQN